MGSIEVFLAVVVAGTAGILTLVAFPAWVRTRSRRAQALILAFLLMTFKGAVLVWMMVVYRAEVPLWLILIDLLIVLMFYVSLAIRGENYARTA